MGLVDAKRLWRVVCSTGAADNDAFDKQPKLALDSTMRKDFLASSETVAHVHGNQPVSEKPGQLSSKRRATLTEGMVAGRAGLGAVVADGSEDSEGGSPYSGAVVGPKARRNAAIFLSQLPVGSHFRSPTVGEEHRRSMGQSAAASKHTRIAGDNLGSQAV